MARGDRIEEGTDVIVTGNLRDAKQGVGVIAALVGLELTLILQKRGRLGKEDAKGTSGSVLYRVTGIGGWVCESQVGKRGLGTRSPGDHQSLRDASSLSPWCSGDLHLSEVGVD